MSAAVTVARQLYRAFAVFIMVLILTGAVAAVGAWQQYLAVQALTDQVLPERLANERVRVVLGDAQRGLHGYLLAGDPALDRVYLDARRDFAIAAAELRRLAPAEDRYMVDRQLERGVTWLNIADTRHQAQPGSDRGVYFSQQGGPMFDLFLESNAELDKTLAKRGMTLRQRTRATEFAAVTTLLGTTGIGGLAALAAAVRAGRRINRPLAGLLSTLWRLRAGDLSARATVSGPAEIQAVAATLNMLTEETVRARLTARTRARLRDAAREAGMRVREQLSVDVALQTAVQILGPEFNADLAVVRLAAREGQERTVWWTAEGDDIPCPLGALPLTWLAARYAAGDVWRSCDVRSDPAGLPESERAALLAAGAVSAMTVPFGTGPQPDGAITLVRRTKGVRWQSAEAEAAGWVATDVARGVQQSRLYEQEQRLVAELRELDRSKTEFLSTVSHELRTPLTSISGFVGLLSDTASGPLTTDQKNMLDVIGRNTNRLRHMIEDLLTLSRIEAGTFETVRQPADVTELMSAAVEAIRSTTALTVRTDCPPGPLVAEVDPHQIDRVLINLLSNAVKFTPAGGEVTVSIHEERDDVLLSVSDTGMGIPDDEQRELFTRFFRASNAVVASIPGTGLGLTIVRTIVANHGGDVTLRSEPGKGTTVTVRLPREPALVGCA